METIGLGSLYFIAARPRMDSASGLGRVGRGRAAPGLTGLLLRVCLAAAACAPQGTRASLSGPSLDDPGWFKCLYQWFLAF